MELPRPVRRRNSIVLTSLVDVMFVLLFFFMLAASAVERRAVNIGLPASAGAQPNADRLARLELVGSSDWRLDGQAIGPADLESRLRESGARRVLVVPTAGVPVQALTDAVMAVRASGLDLRLGRTPSP